MLGSIHQPLSRALFVFFLKTFYRMGKPYKVRYFQMLLNVENSGNKTVNILKIQVSEYGPWTLYDSNLVPHSISF